MSFDIKKITENSKFQPCFCAFDVLYYNGKSLVGPPENGGVPLYERVAILDSMFRNIPGVIQRSERQIVEQGKLSADILEALNRAIDDQEEGIVVKDVASYYIANRRNAGWYKIKPEYTDSTMQDLDLVIIGADEATDKSFGRACSYYLACADTAEPGSSDQNNRRWVCVGSVYSGLSHEERDKINNALQKHWVPTRTAQPPKHLYFNKKKPDLWIMPEHSIILQVRATELICSTSYGADYTLRFPRVERIRDDKPLDDVMTLHQLNNLVDNKKPVSKLAKNQITHDQIDDTKVTTNRKRTSKMPQVAKSFKIKKSEDVEVVSRALLGRKLCILSDDEDCSKEELAKIVESHGGTLSEDSGEVWCCVVGRATFRTRRAVAGGALDVVPTGWLRSLPRAPSPVPLAPLHMLATKPDTILAMCRQYDAFGDSYTTPIDVQTLQMCFNKMAESAVEIHLTKNEMIKLDEELFDGGYSPFSFLRSCFIHAVCMEDSVDMILAKMYGATFCDARSDRLTHVVVPDHNSVHIESLRGTKGVLVTQEWLKACILNKTLVSEATYIVTPQQIIEKPLEKCD